MNYDFIKDDIAAIIETISSIPNITSLDTQITALKQQAETETDQAKKAALDNVITAVSKVQDIKNKVNELSTNPEKFVAEFDKIFCPADESKGFNKSIITFDDAIIDYNKADHFEKNTIPGSTINNVTKILEQMNRVSLMYVCVHDKVLAARHKEEVDALTVQADNTNRQIGELLKEFENTDKQKLSQDVRDTEENLQKAKDDLDYYLDSKNKEEFMKPRDEILQKLDRTRQQIAKSDADLSSLNNLVHNLDSSPLINEAKELEKLIQNGYDIDDENLKAEKDALQSEMNELKKAYEEKDQELKKLKEAAGPGSAPVLNRLEKLFENTILRNIFANTMDQLNALIPVETKKTKDGKLNIDYVCNHLADEKGITDRNLILTHLLTNRLSDYTPPEVKNAKGGFYRFPICSRDTALVYMDLNSATSKEDQELLDFIKQLGEIESILAQMEAIRSQPGMTEAEYERITQNVANTLMNLKKSPLYAHGMHEYMNLYNEKIELASRIDQAAFRAASHKAATMITSNEKDSLKKQLTEKKRAIYNHCKAEVVKLPDELKGEFWIRLGDFDGSKSIEEFEKLYTAIKELAADQTNVINGNKDKLEKAAKHFDNEAYLHSEKLWNKYLENSKRNVELMKQSHAEYSKQQERLIQAQLKTCKLHRKLKDEQARIEAVNGTGICAGVNYFDSLASHARRLADASVYTKKDGHRDSSEYEAMVNGIKRLTTMYSITRNGGKETTFGKYDEKISMTAGVRIELNDIKTKADAYIRAKNAQRFHWFPSTMRKYRLAYAQNVLDFCESQLETLENVSFEDTGLKEDKKAFEERTKKIAASKPLTQFSMDGEIWRNRKTYIDYAKSAAPSKVPAGGEILQPSGQPMLNNQQMSKREEFSTSTTAQRKRKLQTTE